MITIPLRHRVQILAALGIAQSHSEFRRDEQSEKLRSLYMQRLDETADADAARELEADFLERRNEFAETLLWICTQTRSTDGGADPASCDHAHAEEIDAGDKWCPACGAFGGYCADGIDPREYLWRKPGAEVHHTSFVTTCAFATQASCGARAGSEVSNELERVTCAACLGLIDRLNRRFARPTP